MPLVQEQENKGRKKWNGSKERAWEQDIKQTHIGIV